MKKLILFILLLSYNLFYTQQPLWFDAFGGTGDDSVIGVTFDSQNNILSTGFFHDTVDFDSGTGIFELTSAGNEDIFVRKTDGNDNFLWAKRFGSNLTDQAYDIKTDSNDNVYVLGTFSGTVDFNPGATGGELTSLGSWDVFILKLTLTGDFVWVKHFGNTGIDYAPSFDLDVAGNIYVTGIFKNTVQFDPENTGNFSLTSAGGYDFYVTKLDNNGNMIFATRFGGTAYDKSRAIHINQNNEILVAAEFKNTIDLGTPPLNDSYTSYGNYDVLILKLDVDGNYLWSKHFGGSGVEHAYSLDTDPNNNIYITGVFSDIVDFDPGFETVNLSAAGTNDAFISKLDDTGAFAWVIPMSNDTEIYTYKVKYAPDNRVYVSGFFNNGITVFSASGFNHVDAVGDDDALILSVDEDGSTIPIIYSFGGLQSDQLYGLAVNNQNNLVASGKFEDQFVTDPNDTSSPVITSNGENDAVILKFDLSALGISGSHFPYVKLYPNPTHNLLHIQSDHPEKISIKVYDVNGRELQFLKTGDFNGQTLTLPKQKGLYFVNITIDGQNKTYRIIVK